MTQPRVFQANAAVYRKQMYVWAGLGIVAANLVCYFKLNERDWKAYAFATTIAVVICVIRYFSIVGINGPDALVFDAQGVTLDQKKKQGISIPWDDLEGMLYRFSNAGHRWEFTSKSGRKNVTYFVDGLTHRQREELRQFVANCKDKLPGVEIDTVGKMSLV